MSDTGRYYYGQDFKEEEKEEEAVSENVRHILDLFELLKPLEKVELKKAFRSIKIY